MLTTPFPQCKALATASRSRVFRFTQNPLISTCRSRLRSSSSGSLPVEHWRHSRWFPAWVIGFGRSAPRVLGSADGWSCTPWIEISFLVWGLLGHWSGIERTAAHSTAANASENAKGAHPLRCRQPPYLASSDTQ